MIVNTETGEIIEPKVKVDLSPLKRKPRGRVSRPKSRKYQRRATSHLEADMKLALILGVALTFIVELAK